MKPVNYTHSLAAALMSLGLFSLALSGCQTDTDPLAQYENLKNSVPEHEEHNTPVKIPELPKVEPQSFMLGKALIVEAPSSLIFTEGAENSFQVKVRSMIGKPISVVLKTEDFPDNVKPVQDENDESIWHITWTPKPGFVPSNLPHSQHRPKLVAEVTKEGTDPTAFNALEDHIISVEGPLVYVARDIGSPEIIGFEWAGREGDNDTIVELEEGEKKTFSVTVHVPGVSESIRPDLHPNFEGAPESAEFTILSGEPYIVPVANPETGESVEKVEHNTWVYHFAFDTQDTKLHYPRNFGSTDNFDAEFGHYRIVYELYPIVDLSGLDEKLTARRGPQETSQTLDFKVQYTGKSSEIRFSWDDGKNTLFACKGGVSNFNILVTSSTGVGKVKVDTAKALASLKGQRGFSGHAEISCDSPAPQVTCNINWSVPSNISDGTYRIEIPATLSLSGSDNSVALVEKSSAEGIVVQSKNAFCSPSAVSAGAASEAAQNKNNSNQEPKND